MENLSRTNLSLRERQVLKELDINARQSATAIGSKLGISKQAVNYHIENMLKKGYIKEFITYLIQINLGIPSTMS
jgi:DNA-binding Lrp family transcriptional regulator